MLFVTHTTISVPALTGSIMCMGVATANSILVVSFSKERVQEGLDPIHAAEEAGFTRFRPVIMTAMAMIIGMVPMALGLGEGGEQNAPLGRAVIGGLLFATVATLLFVPSVYSLIHGFRKDPAEFRRNGTPGRLVTISIQAGSSRALPVFGGSDGGCFQISGTRRNCQPVNGRSMEARPAPGSKVTRVVMLLLVVIIVALVVVWGISSRRKANAQLSQETHELAIPTVSVIHPKTGAPQQEIVIPGDMQPYTDAPIYARTNGYLKNWYADIGANVKAGQLLAEIDSPEVDQQLQQARADLATAQANLNLAEITATRYKDLLKTDSVAQQDVDNATGNYDARRTAVESAQSNVKRLEDIAILRKSLRALRRRDHGAQHRYRPADRFRQQRRHGPRTVSHCGREPFARLCQCPAILFSTRSSRGCARSWFSPNSRADNFKERSSGVPEPLTIRRAPCSPKSTSTIPPTAQTGRLRRSSSQAAFPREHVHASRQCDHFQIRGLASGDCERRQDDFIDPGYAGPGFRNGDRNCRGTQRR